MPKVANVTLATSATDAKITHVVWSAASASPDASIAWYRRFKSGDICAVTPSWMINALQKKRRPSVTKDVECAWVESSSSAKRARTPSSSSTDDELLPFPPMSVVIGDVKIFGHSFGTLPLFVGYTDQYEAASAPAQVQVLTDLTAAFAAASKVTSGSTLLIDTADAYSAPNTLNGGEQVIAATLRAKTTPSTVIATKGGMRRVGPLSRDWETVDLSPGGIKRAIRASHAALNTGVADVAAHAPIFLWQIHHVKGTAGTRIDATVRAMRAAKEMQVAGLVRHLGLSNCSVAQIEAVIDDGIDIASVQNSLSLWDRNAAKPVRGDKPVTSMHGVLELCKQHKIAFIAHGPLGGLRSRDMRRDLKQEYPELAALAARKGISAHALALAVLRYRWPKTVITIAGARTSAHAIDSVLGAAAIRLTRAELDDLWPPSPSSTNSSSSSSIRGGSSGGAKRRRISDRHSYAVIALLSPLQDFQRSLTRLRDTTDGKQYEQPCLQRKGTLHITLATLNLSPEEAKESKITDTLRGVSLGTLSNTVTLVGFEDWEKCIALTVEKKEMNNDFLWGVLQRISGLPADVTVADADTFGTFQRLHVSLYRARGRDAVTEPFKRMRSEFRGSAANTARFGDARVVRVALKQLGEEHSYEDAHTLWIRSELW